MNSFTIDIPVMFFMVAVIVSIVAIVRKRASILDWIRAKQANYRLFMLKRRKWIMPILFIIFLILGYIWMLPVYGPLTSAANRGETHTTFTPTVNTPTLDVLLIELKSTQASEIWTINDSLRIVGAFRVADLNLSLEYGRIGNLTFYFMEGEAFVSTTHLETGWHRFYLYGPDGFGGTEYKGFFHFYKSVFTLFQHQVTTYLIHFSMTLFVGVLPFIPVCYLFVIRPSRKAVEDTLFPEYVISSRSSRFQEYKLARTERIIKHLAKRIDYYYGKRTALLTTCAGLLTIMAAIPVSMYQLGFATDLIGGFFYFELWTLGSVIAVILYLHGSTTPEFLPSTSWFFRGRISEDDSKLPIFMADLSRNYWSFLEATEKDCLRDNVTEIVSLYYILRNARDKHTSALGILKVGIAMLIVGFAFIGLILLDAEVLTVSVFVGFFVLGALYETAFPMIVWWKEELSTIIHALYYCSSDLDGGLEINRDVREMVIQAEYPSFGVHDTCRLRPAERVNICNQALIDAKNTMTKMGLTPLQFGTTQYPSQDFGGRIAVLITREYGERTAVIMHPHFDSKGKLVTIAEYIKKNWLSESN